MGRQPSSLDHGWGKEKISPGMFGEVRDIAQGVFFRQTDDITESIFVYI